MEGSLSKWTNVVNGWQYRWFVLDDNAGLLSYYTSKEKMMRGARREVWVSGITRCSLGSKSSLSKHDFDRKVSEADAFLQLLIDQIVLIEGQPSNETEKDNNKQEKYGVILVHANSVLNSIKHTIVQLQIAKNTAIPVNGILQWRHY
ncbi:hypothetical protein KQX54_001354 [Cotesia glomerata]|uniref:PH domain-containing protein n=1 Tax=Cotesia glomerata TaxID=32391 RepID=A0AAV7IF16_COTGL|nr:hypothetical protein KQX54_001354 [Cotesia glomerata]